MFARAACPLGWLEGRLGWLEGRLGWLEGRLGGGRCWLPPGGGVPWCLPAWRCMGGGW